MKLLIATTNPGKLADMKSFLSDLDFELISLGELGIKVAPEETGSTLEENAILKARHYCKLSGLPTISDDAGAEIDALGGEPGVHTKRWINRSRDSTDEEIIQQTIRKLKNVPPKNRGMQLRSVIALALPNGNIYTSEGIVRGRVAQVPSTFRYPGFPFRSLMYLPELQNKFYNHTEMTTEENQKYNHRIKALVKLKNVLRDYLTKSQIHDYNKVKKSV